MAGRSGVLWWCMLCAFACCGRRTSASELTIFVENPGGEILCENVTTFGQNIVISFERRDASEVTVWYDYANSVQIVKFLVSGEEELNQPGVTRTVCYAVYFDRDSMVPVNAMYKLRQRNAHAVRTAEMDKGREEMYFDTKLAAGSARELSAHLAELCVSTNVVHTRQKDLQSWMNIFGDSRIARLQTTKVLLNPMQQVLCSSNPAPWAPCSCRLTSCVLWYPCALRFCENNGVCGIRTCSKCYDMFHTEDSALRCIE
ncbi:out at first protein [Galendromus occidentalis]|uniref:Out at first protein n=1 Tax=Galendromus occidentalis TaxID=34638 RepID=A0AAJ6VXL7_9ACAR|nr:out at first protein [Galendromus occidentalis]